MKVFAYLALLGLSQAIRVEDEQLFFEGSMRDFLSETPPVNNADGSVATPSLTPPPVHED